MRKVIAWVKGLFVRAPAGVPDCISDFWYCGEWYLYRSDRHDGVFLHAVYETNTHGGLKPVGKG